MAQKTFKQAWQEARNKGLATFSWKGNDYNTKKDGESDAAWARALKGRGNTAIGAKAQYRVHYKGQDATVNERTGQVQKVNGGGFYATDTSGKRLKGGFKTREEAMAWIRKNTNNKGGRVFSEQKQTSAPYADQSAKASGKVKVTAGGTNNGTTTSRKTNNRGTTITVGKAPKGEQRKDYRPNGAKNTGGVSEVARNVSAGQFADALSPTTFIANTLDAGWSALTGNKYNPTIYRFGLNPFGYSEDLVNGNVLGTAVRGLDTMAWLPGLLSPVGSYVQKYVTNAFAPRIPSVVTTTGSKSSYLSRAATEPILDAAGNETGQYVIGKGAMNAASRGINPAGYGQGLEYYGPASINRAIKEGVFEPMAGTTGGLVPNIAVRNTNTGLTYAANIGDYMGYPTFENGIQRMANMVPWLTPAVDYSMQHMYNHNNDTE